MSWKLVKRIIAGLFGLSAVAMAVAAATADSDRGVRSNGSNVDSKADWEQ